MLKKKWFIAIPLVLVVVLGIALRGNAQSAPENPSEGMFFASGEAQTRGGASGSCGENMTWELDEEGTLTIAGTGMMDDYVDHQAPWTRFDVPVRKVVIKAGVFGIGKGAFADCGELTELVFEGSAPAFGDLCFDGVAAAASYPAGNDTWVSDVMQNYGGDISWVENSN